MKKRSLSWYEKATSKSAVWRGRIKRAKEKNRK